MLVEGFNGIESVECNEKDTVNMIQLRTVNVGLEGEGLHYDHIVEYVSGRQLVSAPTYVCAPEQSHDKMILFGSLFLEKGSFCGI